MRRGPRASSGVALGALVLFVGCYTRLVPVDGRPAPIPLPTPEHPFASVGIALSEASITPKTAFFTAEDVAERFARRVARERVFAPVVFPYPREDVAEPQVVLAVTVRMEEKYYEAANFGKAVLHGLTVLTLLPLVPFRVGFVVDLSVTGADARGSQIDTYAARSEYDLVYAWLEVPRDAEDAWLMTTADQAIEEIVNQIKGDYSKRERRSVRAGRSARWRER